MDGKSLDLKQDKIEKLKEVMPGIPWISKSPTSCWRNTLGAKSAYYFQDKRLSGTGILPAYDGGNGLEPKRPATSDKGMIKGLQNDLDWTFYFFRVPKKVKHGYRNVIEFNFRDQYLAAGAPFFFKQWGSSTRRIRSVYLTVECGMICLGLQIVSPTFAL